MRTRPGHSPSRPHAVKNNMTMWDIDLGADTAEVENTELIKPSWLSKAIY